MPIENNIEIRSEEVQEIMGHIPGWIIRWGVTLIFIVIMILLTGAWFFKYPDVINSPVTVTTEKPSAHIVAKVNGRIEELIVEDFQLVNKNDVLAIIENPGLFDDIKHVKNKIDLIDESVDKNNFNVIFKPYYKLGLIQTYYSRFINNYNNLKHFVELDYHHKKISSINEQVILTNTYYSQVLKQKEILEEELILSENEYNRAKTLFEQEVISSSDFEKKQAGYLQNKYALEGAKTNLSTTKIQLANLKQSILDLELNARDEDEEVRQIIYDLFGSLGYAKG